MPKPTKLPIQKFIVPLFCLTILNTCQTQSPTELVNPIKSQSVRADSASTQIVTSFRPSPDYNWRLDPNRFSSCRNSNIKPSELIEYGIGQHAAMGEIYDHEGKPLKNTLITLRSLNKEIPFSHEYLSEDGTYDNICTPAGVQIEIIASKPGYSTRRRVQVLQANKHGFFLNRYDFGTKQNQSDGYSVRYEALSPLPEVTEIIPKRRSQLENFPGSFELTFSKPVFSSSVEGNFRVRREPENPAELLRTVVSPADVDFVWNEDNTHVRIKRSNNIATQSGNYRIELHNVIAQDGYSHDRAVFKLTDGDFENSSSFEIH